MASLVPHLSFSIPEPIAMGKPSKNYPWNWSIYKWIEGESANNLIFDNDTLKKIAVELASFLSQLHKIDSSGGPVGGLHNYYRGNHLSVYDKETRSYLGLLKSFIDSDKALKLWDRAISTSWDKNPVWVHGDFASGNILIKNGKIVAIIDFGCMGIGDPACDLVIAWTLLKDNSRVLFKEHVELDSNTWLRAKGWALWKACFELISLEDKTSPKAKVQQHIITEVIQDYEI